MSNFYDYTYEELTKLLLDNGFKKFNANQLFEWVYSKRITEYDKMSNLSKKLIEFLKSNISLNSISIKKVQRSSDTNKYLFELYDGNLIEAVLMRHNYGNSLCISTEVGCNMGCAFCESGRLKLVRKLFTHEMVEQILQIEKCDKISINNVVLMGIGEPFDNYDNVIRLLSILTDNKALNIGQRKITVSTCGIVPKIKEFTKLKNQVNLAISLHAPNDELRSKLMKINNAYKIKEVFEALDEYIEVTNRRVTVEYILLDGVNDSEKCANELANLIGKRLMYVNLIPYNETSHIEFKKSNKDKIMKFYDILKKRNINVTVRVEFGSEISGACGQLRAEESLK